MSNEKKAADDFNFGSTEKVASGSTAAAAVVETPKAAAVEAAAPEATATATATATETAAAPKRRGRPKKGEAGKSSARISNVGNKAITNVAPKEAKKEPSAREQFLEKVKTKSEAKIVPEIGALFAGMANAVQTKVKICDIAVFIEGDAQDPFLKGLQDKWNETCVNKNAVNICNLNAQVSLKNVESVGIEILQDGHLFTPIQIVKLTDHPKSSLQAISGRHRLAFLAIQYGLQTEVPVIISEYDLNTARCAVIQANKNRRSGVLEEDGFHVLRATGGNLDIEREELYHKSVKRKTDVPAFAVVTVLNPVTDRAPYGMKLHFKVQEDGNRASGLTTRRSLRNFWKKALTWEPPMTRKDFDEQLKGSVSFLNSFVESIEGIKGFVAAQHLSTRAMVAVASMFRLAVDTQKDPVDYAKKIAKALVDQGDSTGSIKSDTIYRKLTQEVKIG